MGGPCRCLREREEGSPKLDRLFSVGRSRLQAPIINSVNYYNAGNTDVLAVGMLCFGLLMVLPVALSAPIPPPAEVAVTSHRAL